MGKNIALVTGGTGWLGRAMVNALIHGLPDVEALSDPDRNLEVRCLVRPGEDTAALASIGSAVTIVHGDVTDPESLKAFVADAEGATLYHCAGIIHPKKVREFLEVNFQGTLNLCEAAEKANIRRAVIVSSNSPIGTNPYPEHLFDEESPYNPYMGYGYSKMVMEQKVQEKTQGWKMETVLIRAPWFYGPYQPPRQTLFFQMIRDGKAPIVGDGTNRRSMVYIENLCQGLLLAGRVPEADGQIYWIADKAAYSMNTIIATIEKVMAEDFGIKCKGGRMKLPSIASEVAYAIDWVLQKAGLYHQKIHVLSEMNKSIACDVSKAMRELGYSPSVDLAEGMKRSIAWIRSQKETRDAL